MAISAGYRIRSAGWAGITKIEPLWRRWIASERLTDLRALKVAHHASPNAGYPEAAFAGALGVRLNGPNFYHGVLVDKPFIGTEGGPVAGHHIKQSCRLMPSTSRLGCLGTWLASLWPLL